MKLTIGSKIMSVVAILIAFVVAISVVSLYKIQTLEVIMDNITAHDISLAGLIQGISKNQAERTTQFERILRLSSAEGDWDEDQEIALEQFEELTDLIDENIEFALLLTERVKGVSTTEFELEHVQEIQEILTSLREANEQFLTNAEEIFEDDDQENAYTEAKTLMEETPFKEGGERLIILVFEFTEASTINAKEQVQSSFQILLYLGSISLLLGLVLGVFVSRNISKLIRNLTNLIANLAEGSTQLTTASQQIAESSQQLSQGATRQAASLEETSSSLEEISSQTKENADNASSAATAMEMVSQRVKQSAENANDAANLSQETRQSAEEGSKAMGDITLAMKEVREGSEQITDIIETINDITHQTKMLATNAAIEEARAGDQGKGFAVVADEVSKLAENSKSAAKEIATLIKDSVRKAQAGSELAEKGETVLKKILEKSVKAADLVNGISTSAVEQSEKVGEVVHSVEYIKTASTEQVNGINQVNQAVSEIDKITQSNAANAEETASSSEELSAQAVTLQEVIIEISKQVGLKNSKAAVQGNHAPSSVRPVTINSPDHREDISHIQTPLNGAADQARLEKKISSSAVIPMRDDFKEF